MKNSISKTLLCGLIASSFILVNCQKGGNSRGVKANKSTSGQTGQTDVTKLAGADAPCSENINNGRDQTAELSKSIQAIILDANKKPKSSVAEGDKVALKDLSNKFNQACKALVEEFAKEKKEACLDPKKQKTDATAISNVPAIKEKCSTLNSDVEKVSGVKAVDPVDSSSTGLSTIDGSSLAINKKYRVATEELAEMLSVAGTKNNVKYIIAGEIQTDLNNYTDLKKDQETTICYVPKSSGKIAMDDELTVLSIEDGKKLTDVTKPVKNINLSSKSASDTSKSSNTYTVSCLVAANKDLATEFSKAFAKHLKGNTVATVSEKKDSKEEEKSEKPAAAKEKTSAATGAKVDTGAAKAEGAAAPTDAEAAKVAAAAEAAAKNKQANKVADGKTASGAASAVAGEVAGSTATVAAADDKDKKEAKEEKAATENKDAAEKKEEPAAKEATAPSTKVEAKAEAKVEAKAKVEEKKSVTTTAIVIPSTVSELKTEIASLEKKIALVKSVQQRNSDEEQTAAKAVSAALAKVKNAETMGKDVEAAKKELQIATDNARKISTTLVKTEKALNDLNATLKKYNEALDKANKADPGASKEQGIFAS